VTSEQIGEILTDRKRAYLLAFGTDAGKAVLDDLAIFCRARETCVIPGDRDRTYVLEGRRETYLRIRDHLDLTPEQLVERYTTPAIGAQGNELP
jgi:phage-related baseplate assembly protein